jgi:hypothetical protein
MGRIDTRKVAAEYRKKFEPFMDSAELDPLMGQISRYMLDVLDSRVSDEASMDRAAFEKVPELLVEDGLAYETKLEECDGGYVLTATDLMCSKGVRPDKRVESVVGELIQLLIEVKTGKKYCVEVAHGPRKTVFKFKREHSGS